jgi:hypothetical protein
MITDARAREVAGSNQTASEVRVSHQKPQSSERIYSDIPSSSGVYVSKRGLMALKPSNQKEGLAVRGGVVG